MYVVALKPPGFRMNIRVPALSDNAGVEGVSNKLFTTSMPAAIFLETLSLLAALRVLLAGGMEMVISQAIYCLTTEFIFR